MVEGRGTRLPKRTNAFITNPFFKRNAAFSETTRANLFPDCLGETIAPTRPRWLRSVGIELRHRAPIQPVAFVDRELARRPPTLGIDAAETEICVSHVRAPRERLWREPRGGDYILLRRPCPSFMRTSD